MITEHKRKRRADVASTRLLPQNDRGSIVVGVPSVVFVAIVAAVAVAISVALTVIAIAVAVAAPTVAVARLAADVLLEPRDAILDRLHLAVIEPAAARFVQAALEVARFLAQV